MHAADGTELDFTVDCGRRGTLDPAYLPVVHVEDYTERDYTNANGDSVVLSVAEGQSSSFIFYESEDYLVTVRSTNENVEALADCFDFAAMVRLSPDLSAVQNTSPSVAEVRDGSLTLADFAIAVASNVGRVPTFSVSCNIEFLNVARGKRLIATADADRSGHTLGFYTAVVVDELGTPVARMTSVVYGR